MSTSPAVYLVDDDTSFLAAQSRMLRMAGFEVHEFSTAAQLLAAVSHETRGCVVTDLSMPDMNGLELQAALARVVVGGIVASTLITLVLIPAIYVMVAEFVTRRAERRERAAAVGGVPSRA